MAKEQQKICVVGSTGHSQVTCVEWPQVNTVNLVDFHMVILNVGTLTTDMGNSALILRSKLSRLLGSGGTIALIAAPVRNFSNRTNNYGWCPMYPAIKNEAGNTVNIMNASYPRLNKFITDWQFYFNLSEISCTSELQDTSHGKTFTIETRSLVENRYGGTLFGVVDIHYEDGIGQIWLLARSVAQEDFAVIGTMLEEVCGVTQVTLPPDWVHSVTVPRMTALQADIDKKTAAIAVIQAETAALEQRKDELNEYKKLLYSTGKELESIFARCLKQLGTTVIPAKYGQEEFILEYEGNLYLAECKGIGKSVTVDHVRQLIDYVVAYEEQEGKPGKGILFGNVWREFPPAERASKDIFTELAISRATRNGIGLVNSVDFFHAFMGFLDGKVSPDSILDEMTKAAGVVDFSK